jgi:hypothetical protein
MGLKIAPFFYMKQVYNNGTKKTNLKKSEATVDCKGSQIQSKGPQRATLYQIQQIKEIRPKKRLGIKVATISKGV